MAKDLTPPLDPSQALESERWMAEVVEMAEILVAPSKLRTNEVGRTCRGYGSHLPPLPHGITIPKRKGRT